MNQLLIAIILTLLPIFELRGGLPVAVDYALKNSLPVFPIFFLIVILNIFVVFFIFFFLDFLHYRFMKVSVYRRVFNFYIRKLQKRADKMEKKMPKYGYFALTLFVAIPLPITGAWTGSLIAWVLDLEKRRSIPAIALGVCIAGIIILLGSLGIISLIRLI